MQGIYFSPNRSDRTRTTSMLLPNEYYASLFRRKAAGTSSFPLTPIYSRDWKEMELHFQYSLRLHESHRDNFNFDDHLLFVSVLTHKRQYFPCESHKRKLEIWGIASFILKLYSRRSEWSALRLRPLYPQRRFSPYPQNRRLSGSRIPSAHSGGEIRESKSNFPFFQLVT